MNQSASVTLDKISLRPEFAWGLIGVLVSAFIGMYFSLQAGVFVLFLLATAWWVWHNPAEGFLLFVIIAPILPMLKITQTIGTATLIKDVIIITLFFKLFFIPLLTKRLPYRRSMVFSPAVLLVVWVMIAMLRADSLILGVLRARDIGLYVLLYLVALYLPLTRTYLKKLGVWFIVITAIILLLGVFQWRYAVDSAVLRFDPIQQVWIPRLSSILAHPSIFGQYLVLAVSLALATTVSALSPGWRLFGGIATVILLPYIYLTYSRGVWLGLVGAVGFMLLALAGGALRRQVGRQHVWRYYAGVIVGIIAVAIVAMRFTSAGVFLRTAFDPTYASNEERLEFLARLMAPVTNRQAMIGRGLGDVLTQNFRQIDLKALDIASGASRTVQLTKDKTLVDNQYLKTFVEMGLVGILIYLWLYWRTLNGSWRLATYAADPARKIIGLASTGFIAAFVIQAFVIDIWDIFPTNAAFWIMAGLVSGHATPLIGTERKGAPAKIRV